MIDRLFKENAELGSELYSQAVENVRAQHRAAKVNAELKDKVRELEEVVAEIETIEKPHIPYRGDPSTEAVRASVFCHLINRREGVLNALSRTETGEILAVETESRCGNCGGDEWGNQGHADECLECGGKFVDCTITVRRRSE